eukprot:18447-Heterococcus_DN1.PRE.3
MCCTLKCCCHPQVVFTTKTDANSVSWVTGLSGEIAQLHAPHLYTRRLNRRRLQKGHAELTDVSDVIEAFWHRADTTANGHSLSDSDDDVALADETENDETEETETDDNPFVAARTNSSGGSRSDSSSPYRAPKYVHSSSSSTATAVTTNTASSSAGTAAASVSSSSGGLRHPLDIDAAEHGNSDSNNSSNGATAAADFSANIHYDYFHRSNSTSNDTKVIDKRRDRNAVARGRLAPELVAQLP